MSCANYNVRGRHPPLYRWAKKHGFLLAMLGVAAFWAAFTGVLYVLL